MGEQHITQEQIDHLRDLHRHVLPEGGTMYYCGASNGKMRMGVFVKPHTTHIYISPSVKKKLRSEP